VRISVFVFPLLQVADLYLIFAFIMHVKVENKETLRRCEDAPQGDLGGVIPECIYRGPYFLLAFLDFHFHGNVKRVDRNGEFLSSHTYNKFNTKCFYSKSIRYLVYC
jgi:hypothetical protein